MNREITTRELYDIADAAVRRMHDEGPAIGRGDMRQAAALWVLENPGRVNRARDADGVIHMGQVVNEILRHLAGLVEQDRRQSSPRGEGGDGRYTAKAVRRALRDAFEEGQPQAEAQEVRVPSDPASGLSWLAARMDVRAAWEQALTPGERGLLFRHYVLGERWEQVVGADGVEAARMRASRAVRDMVLWLNGGGARVRGLGDGPGSRRVVSSAQARAAVEGL